MGKRKSSCLECVFYVASAQSLLFAQNRDLSSFDSFGPAITGDILTPLREVDLPLALLLRDRVLLLESQSTTDSTGLFVSEVKRHVCVC